MSEQTIFNTLILCWFSLATIVFVSLFFFNAPYGRYIRNNWGPTISNKKGWIIMESAAPLVFAACFLMGRNPTTTTTLILLILWEAHYVHRAYIYPFSLHSQQKRMPIVIVSSAFIFNVVNGYLNGRYIFLFSSGYTNEWLVDARFVIGVILFITGFVINRRADHTLRNLRKPDESDYKIPYGEMYRWISCPNYLGEIVIWIGWAVATWSLPGFAFAVWTMANLIPRARSHHIWYKEQFSDYPTKRRALLPRIW